MAFSDWLLEEIEKSGLSYSEIGRRAGFSHARISQVVSGDKPSADFCIAIAKGLDLPPTVALSRAGYLPRMDRKNELTEKLLHHFDQLPEPQQRNLLRVAWAMAQARDTDAPMTIELEPPGIPANPAAGESCET